MKEEKCVRCEEICFVDMYRLTFDDLEAEAEANANANAKAEA